MSDLHAVVAQWCDARRVKLLRSPVLTDEAWWVNGQQVVAPPVEATSGWAAVPPLLQLLTMAAVPSGESGKATGRGTTSPVDWDAVDLLDRLREVATSWQAAARLTSRPTLTGKLRQLGGHTWEPDDGALLARLLGGLARRADAHLTPPEVAPWRYVRENCPQCGYKLLTTVSADGSPVTGFALMVEFERGFVDRMICQVCWWVWTRQDLADWASGATA